MCTDRAGKEALSLSLLVLFTCTPNWLDTKPSAGDAMKASGFQQAIEFEKEKKKTKRNLFPASAIRTDTQSTAAIFGCWCLGSVAGAGYTSEIVLFRRISRQSRRRHCSPLHLPFIRRKNSQAHHIGRHCGARWTGDYTESIRFCGRQREEEEEKRRGKSLMINGEKRWWEWKRDWELWSKFQPSSPSCGEDHSQSCRQSAAVNWNWYKRAIGLVREFLKLRLVCSQAAKFKTDILTSAHIKQLGYFNCI